jgi:hypothetical protein
MSKDIIPSLPYYLGSGNTMFYNELTITPKADLFPLRTTLFELQQILFSADVKYQDLAGFPHRLINDPAVIATREAREFILQIIEDWCEAAYKMAGTNLNRINTIGAFSTQCSLLASRMVNSTKAKETPTNHHVKALYLVYTGAIVNRETHGNSIYNKWAVWKNKDARTKPGDPVGVKTKLSHLKAVKTWLQSEGKSKAQTQCNKDIQALIKNSEDL